MPGYTPPSPTTSALLVTLLVLAGLSAGCTRVVEFAPGDSGVDADGRLDAARDARVDLGVPCPSENLCSGNALVRCVDGEPREEVCLLGCGGAPSRCARLRPTTIGDAVSLARSRADVVVPSGETWVWDTTSGRVDAVQTGPTWSVLRAIRAEGTEPDDAATIGFSVVSQASPDVPTVGVFSVGRLRVESGARLFGTGDRPLALVAADAITIAGTVSVAADLNPGAPRPGPGGFGGALDRGGAGLGPGGGGGGAAGDPIHNDFGGGGAGFGSEGGSGGRGGGDAATSPGVPGAGGRAYGVQALGPLIGGSGGGGGSSSTGRQPLWGGNGGGALQLVAGFRVELTRTGIVDASGGGSPPCVLHGGAGGGGGSGGAILIEAPVVVIDGIAGTNGGAGAQGSVTLDANSLPGSPGRADRAPAPGSGTVGLGGGGGAGSDPSGVPSQGVQAQNGGGGGGGAGRIRINTATGQEPFPNGLLPTRASGLATTGALDRVF